MDDVPIEISAEDHFSHETLSLVVCVSEIIGQTGDDHWFEFVLRTSTIGQFRRTLRREVLTCNHRHIHTYTRATVQQEEHTGERCRSVANFSANGKRQRNVI